MRDLALERAHTSAKVVTSGLKANLQAYERFHIGEKIYKCKSCDKWFSLKGTLQKHERYLARERPYHWKHVISGFLEKRVLRISNKEQPFFCLEQLSITLICVPSYDLSYNVFLFPYWLVIGYFSVTTRIYKLN